MIFKKKKEAKYYKNVVYIYICEVHKFAACTSRNRLPAAVTEFTKAFFMQFFLGTYRGPIPHSTVLLSSQYTDGNYHSTGRGKKKN